MKIAIPKESLAGENRVSATPNTVTQLKKLGFEVLVETGAGLGASFSDKAYQEAGAEIGDKQAVWSNELIYKLNPPNADEVATLQSGQTLVSFFQPAQNSAVIEELKAKKVNVLAMDMVPRISRAQSMDALSSMANISGYRAVIEAANAFGRFFTGQITAAGKVPPAQVLVIGAGVAGLAAIGTAVSLGAVVKAFDSRPETKEQVKSMGASFLEINFKEEGGSGDGYAKVMSEEFNRRAEALYAEQAKQVDIIITTAAIPGKPSPKLITKEMVASMKAGSVIVDLAALGGGNCELTKAGEVVITDNGVKIIGYTDMANRLAGQSSQLYSQNLVNLSKLLCPNKDGQMVMNFDDVIIRNMTVVYNGEVMFPPPPIQVSAQPQQKSASEPVKKEEKPVPAWQKALPAIIAGVAILGVGLTAPSAFLSHFVVFVLSCVIGYYVVWNVSHSLHTPLMSVTNAISGIIVVGALLQIGQAGFLVSLLAFIAILLASINIFGGFFVTNRMLKMFRKG